MPARSKSQQRLFGMVHAYNKGEFHGPRGLRARLARLSKNISDEDASHFARTPHEGLPEKKAQAYLRPDQIRALIARMPPVDYSALIPREEEREEPQPLVGSALRGAVLGTAAGGLVAGGLGGLISYKATAGQPFGARITALLKALAKTGLWGASRGAAAGAVLGTGLNIYNRVRS